MLSQKLFVLFNLARVLVLVLCGGWGRGLKKYVGLTHLVCFSANVTCHGVSFLCVVGLCEG